MGAWNSVRGADHGQELQAILEHAVHHAVAHVAVPVTHHRLLLLQCMHATHPEPSMTLENYLLPLNILECDDEYDEYDDECDKADRGIALGWLSMPPQWLSSQQMTHHPGLL